MNENFLLPDKYLEHTKKSFMLNHSKLNTNNYNSNICKFSLYHQNTLYGAIVGT